jgi:septal ring-binding cell division protein DamX
MASVEDEIANLKTGMDELSAELQSQSREPMLADADAGAQSPLLADGQPMEGGPDVSPAPPSDLTAMRWPDAEEDIGSEFDADRIAAAGTAPESSQADLDAPLMDVTETTDDALTVGTPTDQDSGSFTAAIPAEEMILTVSAYGVQLGAMRRESGARALADMTGLDPKTLFMQASGSWQFVILGWFAERDEARAAMDALPGTVRQLRPLIRFVEAGSRVKPVDGPVIR